MAQVIRSRLSAVKAAATLFIVPAKDYVLNRPLNPRLTDAYLAEVISSVPNMNNTGRLPSIGLVHLGMVIRLTNTVEAPEAVTDSTGEIVGIDLDPDEPSAAIEHTSAIEGVRILHRLPTITVKLHGVRTEFLPPMPCTLHATTGACRDCTSCDFRAGCIAVEPQPSRRSFPVEVQDPGSDTWYTIQVQRRQLPMTIKTASTINTLQGVTTDPGLIFHWEFPRFFSEELRWLSTCISVQASFSGAADICGTARRVAKHYRGWAARGHSVQIQRQVQGEGGGHSFESCRNHARVGLGCNRLRLTL